MTFHLQIRETIMKTIYLLLLLLIVSCNGDPMVKKNTSQESPITDSLKTTIIGRWGGLGEKYPVLEIRKDSIYFFDRKESFPYTISKGNLIIGFPDSKVALINIHVKGDTLFSEDEKGFITKGYRFR